ncbi:hypothetical protein [Melissococcus plutonius]|uniref:hypothetical protein n=1 Tax=Melissococcus plutonius TaxID=33970 RepID=UPI003C2AEE1C
MNAFMDFLSFIGEWLLYTFPFYQGCLEIMEQVSELTKLIGEDTNYKEVSPWFWVVPFLKPYLERRRALEIVRERNMNENDLYSLLMFSDRASAWFFVSLAGFFKGTSLTYELFKEYFPHHNPLWIVPIIWLIITLTIFNAVYRLSGERATRIIRNFLSHRR